MGDLTFGKSFQMLENKKAHPVTEMLRKSLEMLGFFTPAPWLMRLGVDLFPRIGVIKQWKALIRYSENQMDERKKVFADNSQIFIP